MPWEALETPTSSNPTGPAQNTCNNQSASALSFFVTGEAKPVFGQAMPNARVALPHANPKEATARFGVWTVQLFESRSNQAAGT